MLSVKIQKSKPMATNTVEEQKVIRTKKKLGAFSGAHSAFLCNAYGILRQAGIKGEIAHLVAEDFNADCGRVASTEGGNIRIKVGTANADGNVRIALSASAKVRATMSGSLLHVCQAVDSLKTQKLIKERTIEPLDLADHLRNYLSDKDKLASTIDWQS